ncbi:lipid-transfer protein [Spirillospora sp. NPDC049024]
MSVRTYVIGVGMTKFEKPGSRDWDYPDMAREAGTKALADAGVPYDEIGQAYVGYVYGESCAGQRAAYELGLTGIPVVNVNNNCATGSTALYLARQAVRLGAVECALALGFEKMKRGSLAMTYDDRAQPTLRHFESIATKYDFTGAPPAPWMFGAAGREHMERYGTTAEQFAKIGHKNHRHSVNNPYAQFQDEYSLEDVRNAPMVYEPLTKLQCSPTSDGGAAAVIAGERFVDAHGLWDRAVEIAGQSLVTDTPASFRGDAIDAVGHQMTKKAADLAYEQAGVGPRDVQVVELHDCFSTNELITYEALGLCGEGEGGALVDSGDNTYGGRYVVNPSGGLISKGHPLGATGLAQCAELTWQLRGEAGKRQVEGAAAALQHNIGIGGAAVVTLYRPAR